MAGSIASSPWTVRMGPLRVAPNRIEGVGSHGNGIANTVFVWYKDPIVFD